MVDASLVSLLAPIAGVYITYRAFRRLQLSRAKHPSITGHARWSKRLARLLPHYEYDLATAFATDGADSATVAKRRDAFTRLSQELSQGSPQSLMVSRELEPYVSDLQFTNANRVPFQYRTLARAQLPVAAVATATDGVKIQNLDGRWAYDLSGSYGVNLLGYDFYKQCIERGAQRVAELGPVLGPYHPLLIENVQWLREISGLDQVSFHMSGTEAVMQAVGLARYHTGRSHVTMFCGAYHGWWDGVQPGIGSQRKVRDVHLLAELSDATLTVLETRKDIACVLINPLQALHPNSGATSDAMLINSERKAGYDKSGYVRWLQRLRDVCSRRGIVLIFDEVFVGFRLGLGGAQEYFGVRADMVTYGKTLGGGLPVGVLCGKDHLMKRFRDDSPSDICFARGTFNSHPYVMASMNEFLRYARSEVFASSSAASEALWDERASAVNKAFAVADVPLKVHNLWSIWLLTYTKPARYNWLLQYYLRAAGLSLAWVGTGRFIFSHNYSDQEFQQVQSRLLSAAIRMRDDGWWSVDPAITNAAIKKQVFRELLAHKLRRREPSALPVNSTSSADA